MGTAAEGARGRARRYRALLICSSVLAASPLRAASTIAFQGFESSASDTWSFSESHTITGGGGSAGVATANPTTDTPASQRILQGTHSFQAVGAGTSVISTNTFSSVSTAGYTGLSFTLRFSSPSTSSTGGVDNSDTFAVKIALNSAAFSATPDITLAGGGSTSSNDHWGYTAALTATTTAGSSINRTGGSSDATNYSTFVVNIPEGTTSLAAQVVSTLNGSPNELWCYDNVTLSGTQSIKNLRWTSGDGQWNTQAANQAWTDTSNSSASAFHTGDHADFANTAADALITVDSGGVSPGTFTIDNAANTYTFDGGAINGSTSLIKSNAGSAILKFANAYTGGTTISAGTLETQTSGALGSGAITLSGGSWKIGANAQTHSNAFGFAGSPTIDASADAQLTGNISWAANVTLNVTGANTITFNHTGGSATVGSGAALHIANGATVALSGSQDSLSDGTHLVDIVNDSTANTVGGLDIQAGTKNVANISGGGNVTVESGATLIASSIRQNALTLHGNAQIRANGSTTSTLAGISIDPGQHLDLANDNLVVTGISAGTWNNAAYDGVSGMVQSGRNSGDWTGTGIITSQSLAASQIKTLAVASAADVNKSTFGGVSVNPSDALVLYTWTGDANLDGKIDADDYFQIDANYNKASFGFNKGDFNYDGRIDGDDYMLIDQAFAYEQSHPGAGPSLAAVPEPACGAVALLLVGHLSSRRRRDDLNRRQRR